MCIQTAELRPHLEVRPRRLCPGEGLGLLQHLVEDVICPQPSEGLALGLRVRGSPVQPSLFPRESIIPNPYHTAMLPLRQML